MTEAEYVMADIILAKCPKKMPFNVVGFTGTHLINENRENYSDSLYSELCNLIISNSDSVRRFLLEEGYLSVSDNRYPYDILTDKGEKARELGGFDKYKEWEKEEIRKKNIEDFPKKKWYIFEPLKILLAIILGIFIGRYIFPVTSTNGSLSHQSTEQSKTLKNKAQDSPKTSNNSDTSLKSAYKSHSSPNTK